MDTEKIKRDKKLSYFGFRLGRGGAHTARTMMLEDLMVLLSCVVHPDASKSDYLRAIVEENCLAKRSGKTRSLSYKYLANLYSLDCDKIIYRALLFFWRRDMSGQPLLALICAYARDPVLRSSAPFVLDFPVGAVVARDLFEEFLENQEPDRFSKATLRSTVQNINSTWTKSGHLRGKLKKVRSKANPTAGSVSYALFLGYLSGVRGKALFQTEYAKLLDCTLDKAVELAEEASRRGWIVFKRVGDIMEALFPALIEQEEVGWLYE